MRLSKADNYSVHTARFITREGHLVPCLTKRAVFAGNTAFAEWITIKRFATKRYCMIQKAAVEQF